MSDSITYGFMNEFKSIVDKLMDVDDYIWSDCEGKSREWIHNQYENEDSVMYDEWGDLSHNILIYIKQEI